MNGSMGANQVDDTQRSPAEQPAIIRRLLIERYRGIEKLDWWPLPGLNVILGAGDVGKTTILDALALLLSPTNTSVITDTDFWGRRRDEGFSIRAILSLPPSAEIDTQSTMLYPWGWDGRTAVAPTLPEDGALPISPQTPVYKVMVHGSPELDLNYEVVQPDGKQVAFTPNLRRAIGIVRLGGDDRNDRDLRLVQGSALDRLLSDKTLRARLGVDFSQDDVKDALQEEGAQALKTLDSNFSKQSLPHNLGLGLNLGQGQSVSALIDLTAQPGTVRLPLTNWGAGTRRLASLAVAQACRSGCPITLIDEAERGLEPYRQRALVAGLARGTTQVFMTTYSATALSAASPSTVWHLNNNGRIGSLDPAKTTQHRQRDPEAFLARLAVICEGVTEVGFVSHLLQTKVGDDLAGRGIKISDGRGNQFSLELLEDLCAAGFTFAGLVDNEQDNRQAWAKLKAKMGNLLMQWPTGCTEAQVIEHVSVDQLESLASDPDDALTQPRINTLIERLRRSRKDVQFPKNTFQLVKEQAGDSLRALIIDAASGYTPDDMDAQEAKTWKKHSKVWFKSESGGIELAKKMFDLGVWTALETYLEPFVSAVRDQTAMALRP
ncbi:ATP-binding protein [Mesorhizobium sp. M0142]|uniref:ATP-dependent nuclease n=1 Tax=unclassified Mesorhizobium TaxID=325217 RepID=UPI0033397ECC